MKKILALFAIGAMTVSGSIFAQLSINFSDKDIYAGSPSPTEEIVKDGLILFGGTSSVTNMGQIEAHAPSINGVSYSKRFKFNGGGYSGAKPEDTEQTMTSICNNMPTQRYVKINVNGAGTVSLVAMTGSNTSVRTIFLTDGTNYIGKLVCNGAASGNWGSIEYGNVSSLYLFANNACNLYSINVSTATSINWVEKNTANYKLLSEGIEIEGSKVKVNIFNSLSQLVKSSNENYVSTSDLSKGNYIVTIEADGAASTVQIMK